MQPGVHSAMSRRFGFSSPPAPIAGREGYSAH
jgi:hypothetical protein